MGADARVDVAVPLEIVVDDGGLHRAAAHVDDLAVLEVPEVEADGAEEFALTTTTRRLDDDGALTSMYYLSVPLPLRYHFATAVA